jgi:hypothetical protein
MWYGATSWKTIKHLIAWSFQFEVLKIFQPLGEHYDVHGATLCARGYTILSLTLEMPYIINILEVKKLIFVS